MYVPHGAVMAQWTPATEGSGFEFPRILKPLEPFRDHLNVVSGLGHRAADTTAVHSLSPTTWLSGVRPKPTQGIDAYAGVTADQIAAGQIGQGTMLPSIELATEDHSGLIGACDRDYGCIYMNTLSWRTPTTPLPMEINPRKVFERMFGQGGSARERLARTEQDRSLLDAITGQAADLQRRLGANDRATVGQYLENVREIERRIQLTGQDDVAADLVLPAPPAGIPFSYEEHIALMYDLLALAYQANITRVFTFMVAREVSNRTYPQVGVPDGHHAVSHHQNRPDKIEKNVKIQQYHVGLFAHFLEKLRIDARRRRLLARSLDHSVRQQHEQQQRARSLPAAEPGDRGGDRPAQRWPPPQVPGPHADGEPARDVARQDRRPDRHSRRQHWVAWSHCEILHHLARRPHNTGHPWCRGA